MPIVINGSTGISGVDGSNTTPAIQGTDTNTGLVFPAADTIAFVEGGTEVMRIDSAGNIGIGTPSPAYKLDVAGLINTTDQFRSVGGGGDLRVNGNFGGTIAGIGLVGANPLMFFTNNTERMRIDSSGNLLFNSGYGSVANVYGCRAWVNFNGSGTVSIRASGGVSSITDNGGVGDYTVNFSFTMPDVNYAPVLGYGQGTTSTAFKFCVRLNADQTGAPTLMSTTQLRVISGAGYDFAYMFVACYR